MRTAERGWKRGERPAWVEAFAQKALSDVPFYRRYSGTDGFHAIPAFSREDLVREPWSFVPDSMPLDDLILYHSSQTTGNRVTVLSRPAGGSASDAVKWESDGQGQFTVEPHDKPTRGTDVILHLRDEIVKKHNKSVP